MVCLMAEKLSRKLTGAISPITKAQLISGIWDLETLSNNGNGDPIAYQRQISLSVGPQVTTTVSTGKGASESAKIDKDAVYPYR